MEIKKTLNTPQKGYYAVIITADYNDGDEITSYKKLSADEFKIAVPMLTDLLTKAIGNHALEEYLETIDDEAIADNDDRLGSELLLPSEDFCETLGITDVSEISHGDAFPHSIYSADNVEILYFAPNGENYRVNLL